MEFGGLETAGLDIDGSAATFLALIIPHGTEPALGCIIDARLLPRAC
jgi:hypothetical protein